MKINMNTSTVVTWMRSMGYLGACVDFKNVKGLYLNCKALKYQQYVPNIVTDVTEVVTNFSLNESASSTMSVM